jgi:hypothetical protein
MQAAAHGGLKNKPEGLSKKEAAEFIKSTKTPYKDLPKKVKKRKYGVLNG